MLRQNIYKKTSILALAVIVFLLSFNNSSCKKESEINFTTDSTSVLVERITVVRTVDFLVSVFIHDDVSNRYIQTDANLTVMFGSDSISKNLSANTNQVQITDGYSQYILKFRKLNYTTEIDTLDKDKLRIFFTFPLIKILSAEK